MKNAELEMIRKERDAYFEELEKLRRIKREIYDFAQFVRNRMECFLEELEGK